MNKLVVLCGAPGSGKSFFSDKLKEMKKDHVHIVSSDALRTLICGDQANMSFDNIMWPMFYKTAKEYANDKDGLVILDAVHAKKTYRIENTMELKELFDEIDLVYFHLNKDIVRAQNLDREFPIPEEALEKIFKNFEHPDEEDKAYFDKYYQINSSNFNQVLEEVAN